MIYESLKNENHMDAGQKNYGGEIQGFSPVYPQKLHAFENIEVNNVIDNSNWNTLIKKIGEVDKQFVELENTFITTLLSKFPKNADMFKTHIGNLWMKLIEERNWEILDGMAKKGIDEILIETAKTLMENFISKYPIHAVLFKEYLQILSKKLIDEKKWGILNSMMKKDKCEFLKEIVFNKVDELKKSDAAALKMRYQSTDLTMKDWNEIHAGNDIEYEMNLLELYNSIIDIQEKSWENYETQRASETDKNEQDIYTRIIV